MGDLRLVDVLEPLAQAASEAINNRERALQWLQATPHVVSTPGARVNVQRGIVVGKDLRGTASNGSFVIDLGRGCLDTHDSVVVGERVRVRSHGKTRVIGAHAKVAAIDNKKARRSTTVVRKRKQLEGGAFTVASDRDSRPLRLAVASKKAVKRVKSSSVRPPRK